ncbi:MAG: magnesium transporter [Erysipelotrichaceae bacterium]|nr:magnesium transporter [Erysipelotrichaceae bacterium]
MLEKIMELISLKDFKRLKELLEDANHADISECLDELQDEDLAIIFRLLPKDEAADIFAYMEPDTQEKLVSLLSDKEIGEVISELFVDDAADLISEMPANLVTRILKNADPQKRKEINEILKYPEDSAGSIMTTEYVDLRDSLTVKEAFDRIRAIGLDKETVYICYVLDNSRHLIGVTTVKDLLMHDYDTKIRDIMEENVVTINTTDDQEEVAKMFDKYDYLAMPVVDGENRMVGIVTVDDAIDVMSEENEEDFEKMAGMAPSDESYMKTSIFTLYKNRIVWLLFLMLSATFTGIIITRYEEAFAHVAILVSFIPMIMDAGGNCGSQSSTMVIRGLATDDIELKDAFKVWAKEAVVAVMCGATLAVVNGVRIMIMYPDRPDKLLLAAVIGLTLIITALLAKSMGALLPMLAKILKMDPATMASPLITTVVDTCSIFIYFNIAVLLMHIAV